MLGIGVAIAVYVMFGQGCVVYRAQHGRGNPSDGEAMAVLVFWPIWILAHAAANYGWSKR